MHLPRLAALVLAAMLALFPVLGTLAQDDQPTQPDPNAPVGDKQPVDTERIDLAAIALDASDVGSEYSLSFEAYLSADQIASKLLGDAVTDAQVKTTGLLWYYESDYRTSDGVTQVRCYIEEYVNEASVKKGFNLFENEDLFSQPGMTSTDDPGLGIGEEPSETTTIKVEGDKTTPASTTIDTTFRVDRLLLGVAIDTTSTTPPDERDLTDFAQRLQERAQAILDGDDLPDIDLTLPGKLLNFAGSQDVDEGYVSFAESFGAGAPSSIDSAFKSGYTRTVALGKDPTATYPFPLISVSASSFSGESAVLSILSNALQATPAFKDLARHPIDPIPGSTASMALTYADPYTNGDPNSVRIYLLIGTDLVTIDVVGAATVDQALAAGLLLAKQETGCFVEGATCGTAELPANFAAAKG